LIWADGGYNAWQVDAAVAKVPVLRTQIVKRSNDAKAFVVLPRRWMVERTFSWFGRNRRLAKDFENLAETLATFVYPGLHPARRQAARKGARGSAKGWDSRPSPGLARTTTLRRFRSFAAMAANWQDRPRADYRG